MGPRQAQWKVIAVCKLKLRRESEQKTSVKREKPVCTAKREAQVRQYHLKYQNIIISQGLAGFLPDLEYP